MSSNLINSLTSSQGVAGGATIYLTNEYNLNQSQSQANKNKEQMDKAKGDSETPNKERVGKQKGNAPRNNQAQNKQVRDIEKKLGLTKDEVRELHDVITGQGYSYQEILEIAEDMFGK